MFSTDLIKSLPDMAGVGTSIHLVYTGLKHNVSTAVSCGILRMIYTLMCTFVATYMATCKVFGLGLLISNKFSIPTCENVYKSKIFHNN